VSHAASDAQTAAVVADSLQKAGIEVIAWPGLDLAPGDSIWFAITSAIDRADAVLVLLSPASTGSTWVTAEASYALAKAVTEESGKLVVPVVVGEPVRIPTFLADIQRLDLTSPDEAGDAIKRLIAAIKAPTTQTRSKIDIGSDFATAAAIQAEQVAQLRASYDAHRASLLDQQRHFFPV
jgi:TIR domain